MMGRPWFLRFLIVSFLLAFFFSHGFGRNLVETFEHDEEGFSVLVSKIESFSLQEMQGKPRMMITVMDYADPEPNVNPRTRYLFAPPLKPN